MGAPTSAKPTPLRNSYWVIPGKVLAGEHPSGSTRESTREKLQRLMAAGVECFIDLTEPNETKAYDRELPFSIEYLRKPIKDHSTPAQRVHMAEILDCMHDALHSGRCVYVHCRAGIGRTGTVIGCFLVERGLPGEAALDELNRLWQQCERSQSWASVPETRDQTEYVLSWKRRGIFDDRGGLTTPNLKLPDDEDDLRPGGGPAPWAHLLGNGQPNSGVSRPKSRAATHQSNGEELLTDPTSVSKLPQAQTSRPGVPSWIGKGSALAPPASSSKAQVVPNAPPGPRGAPAPGGSAVFNAPPGPNAAPGPGVSALLNASPGANATPAPSASSALDAPLGLRRGSVPGAPSLLNAQPGANASPAPSASSVRDAPLGPRGAPAHGASSVLSTPPGPNAAPGPGASSLFNAPSGPNATSALNASPGSARAAAGSSSSALGSPRTDEPPASGVPPAESPPSRSGTSSATGSRPSARDSASSNGPANAVTGSVPTGSESAPPLGDAAQTSSPTSSRPGTSGVLPTIEDAADADPLLDQEALSAASNLRGRFLGALVGLAIGDAVAAATQYRRPGSFTPVGDMLGGGPFDLPRGGWSDDTAMALCLADSLLDRNGFDARDQMERYRRWQQQGYLSATGQCVGITASTARAIAMAQWRRQALFGSHDPSQQDPEPLSRVAAAVLFFFAISGEAINQATEAARTTCQAPAVLEACRALARALYAALTGQPKATVLEKAALAIPITVSVAETASAIVTGAGGAGPVVAQRVGSTAPAALAAAVAAFGATDNFRDAILYAANLGGDSDVVTSVCGQLAGAYYSVKAIPTSWYNGLMQKELITGYVDRLLAHAMESLSR